MFFCTPKYDYIIQIDDTVGQIKLSQCVLHQTLEGCIHVTQSKGHPGEFIEPKVANCQRNVLLQLWGHANLPKSTLEIHGGEMCSSGHALQHLLCPGKRVGIFLCLRVETSKINAELQSSIFLSHQYHCITPGGLARLNGTSLQHVS